MIRLYRKVPGPLLPALPFILFFIEILALEIARGAWCPSALFGFGLIVCPAVVFCVVS